MCKGRENMDRQKCSQQQLLRVYKALLRAGDVPKGSWICLSHRNLISLWGHSKKPSKISILERLYTVIDKVGRNNWKTLATTTLGKNGAINYAVAGQLKNLFTPKTKDREIRKYGKPH